MTWKIGDQLDQYSSYEAAREGFEWEIPDDYTLPWDLLRKHEHPEEKIALVGSDAAGERFSYSYADLDRRSNKLANEFESRGVGIGDAVAVYASQRPEVIVTYLACWKVGAMVVPISTLLGTQGVTHRLADSGSELVLFEADVGETLAESLDGVSSVTDTIQIGGESSSFPVFDECILRRSSSYDVTGVDRETPALIQYTSGTTGPPKGVVHTHEWGAGCIPGFYMMYDQKVHEPFRFWTHADWGWIIGPQLTCCTLHQGGTMVAAPMGQFDPEETFDTLARFDVTITFIAPTACRMMMDVEQSADSYDLALETIVSSGEPLTPEIVNWVEGSFDDVSICGAYGQTEATPVVADCPEWFEKQPGSPGKAVVGHDLGIIDNQTGERLPTGEVGEVAIRRSNDPLVFKAYWNRPEANEETRLDDWHLTGDLAKVDDDGYFWYKTRVDDVIITSGYRVGPGEVESAILEHEDVEQVGVIGVPDETRGEVIKAFVKPSEGVEGSETLKDEIQQRVRKHLAKYEYPRKIEFRDDLPLTISGKIRRRDLKKEEGVLE